MKGGVRNGKRVALLEIFNEPDFACARMVMVPAGIERRNHARESGRELPRRSGCAKFVVPAQLSGGENSVALARAFINRPKIFCRRADTGNLDTEKSHRIVEAIFALKLGYGSSMVLVKHDLEIATRAQRMFDLRVRRGVEEYEGESF